MVTDVPGYKSRGSYQFEKSDCEQWAGNALFNSNVFVTCDTVDGMTFLEGSVLDFGRLTAVQSLTCRDEHRILDLLQLNPPKSRAAFDVSFDFGIYTYDPEDVIRSSVSGWLDYGYK